MYFAGNILWHFRYQYKHMSCFWISPIHFHWENSLSFMVPQYLWNVFILVVFITYLYYWYCVKKSWINSIYYEKYKEQPNSTPSPNQEWIRSFCGRIPGPLLLILKTCKTAYKVNSWWYRFSSYPNVQLQHPNFCALSIIFLSKEDSHWTTFNCEHGARRKNTMAGDENCVIYKTKKWRFEEHVLERWK